MPTKSDDRETRLAAALRANLRKRKERDATVPPLSRDGKGALNE
jgi:hypothetical protein